MPVRMTEAAYTRQFRPTEEEEQIALFDYIALKEAQYPILRLVHMVPNGAKLPAKYRYLPGGKKVRYSAEGQKLKQQGLRPGIPDIECPVARQGYHGLHIELKRLFASPSDTAPEQREMHALLRVQGRRVEICKGWIEAWNILCQYLGLEGEQIT